MSFSPQNVADRLEIEDLIRRWAHALDGRNWSAYEACYTDDATVDFGELGSRGATPQEHRRYLEETAGRFQTVQHLVAGTVFLEFEEDRAETRTICFASSVLLDGQVVFAGVWFNDIVRRTPGGWRLQRRYAQKAYFHNLPEDVDMDPVAAAD